jgi:hypothetical protein
MRHNKTSRKPLPKRERAPTTLYRHPQNSTRMQPMRFITRFRDPGAFGTNTSGQMTDLVQIHNPSISPEWGSLSGLFDCYKVAKVIVRYLPRTTQASLSNSLAVAYAPIFVVYDPDSQNVPTSVDQCIQYTNMKVYNLFEEWSYTVVNPHVRNTALSGLGAASVTYDPVHGMILDVGSATNNITGIVTWYADNIMTPSAMADTLGQLLVEWHIDFFVRR